MRDVFSTMLLHLLENLQVTSLILIYYPGHAGCVKGSKTTGRMAGRGPGYLENGLKGLRELFGTVYTYRSRSAWREKTSIKKTVTLGKERGRGRHSNLRGRTRITYNQCVLPEQSVSPRFDGFWNKALSIYGSVPRAARPVYYVRCLGSITII